MFYAFTSYKNIKLFQIDVKSTFLNKFLNEEVFVEQSLNVKKYMILKIMFTSYQNHIWSET